MQTDLELIYENILLEKDHRRAMMRFGIPEDVANYLHEFNDKYSIWFANQIQDIEGYQRATNKVTWLQAMRMVMQQIVDWISNSRNINIKDFTWQDAIDAAEEWHDSLESRNIENQEKNHILKQFDDGFYWVDLATTRSCEEGGGMGHCGTTNAGETLWSLRKYDPKDNSIETFITMAISPSKGAWHQAKGKRNSKPKEEYWPYIVDVLVDGKIFGYSSEYDSRNDFGVEDFKEYLENNPNKYENQDEIEEKLEESGIEARADELWEDYRKEFTEVSVDYSVEDDHIWATGWTSFDVDSEDIPELPYIKPYTAPEYSNYLNHKSPAMRRRQDFLEIIKDTVDDMRMYVGENWEYSEPFTTDEEDGILTLTINLEFDMDRSGYGDEIDMFKGFLEDMVEVNNTVAASDFKEDFIEKFKEKLEAELIIDPEYEMPKIDNPDQMKFDLKESTFNECFNNIINN